MKKNIFVAFCLVVTGIAAAQPADFGDALMEPIPTLLANGGPYHLDTSKEWIGSSSTCTTTTETDALPTDFNDGYIVVREVYFNSQFANMGQVCVPVTTTSDAAVRYLNVALDLNNDGVFATYPVGTHMQYEWVVVNLPIVFVNESKVVTSVFTLQAPLVSGAGRATLSTAPIDPMLYGPVGWDGRGPAGGFARGETEDFAAFTTSLYYYDSLPGSIQMPAPPVYYLPENKPFPNPPVYETPKGPAGPWPVPEVPAAPGQGETPYTPESDEPERLDNPPPVNPVADQGSVANMPDIKQGPNECVPASTANPLRYMFNKAGMTPPGDSDAFNKDLFDKLKEAMKTNQGSTGTVIDPENPNNNNFIKGKQAAKIHDTLRNGKVTTVQQNPTRDNLINAIKQGKNVEIVITRYNSDGTVGARHMVTVVGFVQYADGTLELKIHDPNDKETGENAGDTVKPPREHTLTIKPGQSDKGGLELRGMVRDGGDHETNTDGDTYVIETMFTEHLAEPLISVLIDLLGEVTTGNPFEMEAILWDKATASHYQWMKDGDDIEGAIGPTYFVPAATPADSGEYTCWAYDQVSETYGVSNMVSVIVVSDAAVPLSSIATMALLSVVLSCCAALILRQKRRVQKQ